MDALRENIKYTSKLVAAACAVLDLECERVNADGGEPYCPLANPGQFDPRVVALALAIAIPKQIGTPCPKTDLHLDVELDQELQAEITILRKGLEDIIQHQEIIGGSMAKRSTVVFIARKALMESEDATQ